MKNIQRVLRIHAIVLMAFGIAFALYGPLMMAFFTVPELNINSDMYWQIAAFARMFGAALFGIGLLLWSLRGVFASLPTSNQRNVLAALILANLMGGFVSITQTSAIWGTAAGWITTGLFCIFLITYIYLIVSLPGKSIENPRHNEDISQNPP